MEMWELVAREQIRDTLARYNWSGDAGRLDGLAETFCVDGVLEIRGAEPLRGRSEIVAFLGGVTGKIAVDGRQANRPAQRRQHPVHLVGARAGPGLLLFHRRHSCRARPFRPLPRRLGARRRRMVDQAPQGVDGLGGRRLGDGPAVDLSVHPGRPAFTLTAMSAHSTPEYR